MTNKKSLIHKLPAVFQTITEEKFFNATIDQVFSKKSSRRLTGFIGRRVSGKYDPLNDFYIPEFNKSRTHYQLEPTAVSRDPETLEKTNLFFYQDLIDKLRSLGGEVGNHDRLFEGDLYSYSPPIDADMFLNFSSYIWLPSGIPPVVIGTIEGGLSVRPGIDDDDVVGSAGTLQAPSGDSRVVGQPFFPAPFDRIENGFRVTFFLKSASDTSNISSFQEIYIVSGVGDSIILTVESQTPAELIVQEFLSYPWDDNDQINNLDNEAWDTQPWDHNERVSPPDYITIERLAADNNAWSRTNRWFHVNTVIASAAVSGVAQFPSNAMRAERPIIQFIKDIQIFKGGIKFFNVVSYIVDGNGTSEQATGTATVIGGQVVSATVVIPGNGYTVPPVITITGDGIDASGTAIIDETGGLVDIRIDNFGTGYSTATLDIAVPDAVIMPEITFGEIDTGLVTDVTATLGEGLKLLSGGDTIIFKNEDSIKEFVWTVSLAPSGSGPIFVLTKEDVEAVNQDIVIVTDGNLPGQDVPGNRAETYIYNGTEWEKLLNQKTGIGQPPLFEIYDIDHNSFNNEFVYPNNNFRGSKIFSYVEDSSPEAIPDSAIGFSIIYRNNFIGTTEIMFRNSMNADEYIFTIGPDILNIEGYPFYRIIEPTDDENVPANWTFFNSWKESKERSKQRVIDEHVVSPDAQTEFLMSANPTGVEENSLKVIVNGNFISATDYVFNNITTVGPFIDITGVSLEPNDSVQIRTFTHDLLPETKIGYFELPSQLEVNPNNEEIIEFSFGDLSQHMQSIILNQVGFNGESLGQNNNYRTTLKDTSLGIFVVQNESPLLKTMLISSSEDLDIITAIRFSQNEYFTFRGNLQKTVKQMMDRDFIPAVLSQEISIDAWVEAAIETLSKARMFSSAFAFSHMIARGTATFTEVFTFTGIGHVLTNFIDLSNVKNEMYVYKVSGTIEILTLVDVDYVISDILNVITLSFPAETQLTLGDSIIVKMYKDPSPAFIPSTPAKLGCTLPFQPKIIEDLTYSDPGAYMILGHDGSKTPAHGTYQTVLGDIVTVIQDFRDEVLLEVERRIYNGIQSKFRNDYDLILRIEEIRPGRFRTFGGPTVDLSGLGNGNATANIGLTGDQVTSATIINPGASYSLGGSIPVDNISGTGGSLSIGAIGPNGEILELVAITFGSDYIEGRTINRYSRREYFEKITESYFSKWTAEFNLDFRLNEFFDVDNYKTWNYNSQVDQSGKSLPGNWRGIFEYYYDTQTPEITPWEMLGFSIKPEWWEIATDTGDGFTGYGSGPWGITHQLWVDIEAGLVRRGNRAGTVPLYARPGLVINNWVPVDGSGSVRTIQDIFGLSIEWVAPLTNDIIKKQAEQPWVYGDGAPIEYVWRSSSEYHFSELEFFYLMRPADFGEKFWSPLTTVVRNGQILSTITARRSINSNEVVHGEIIDREVTVNTGYQVFVSDRLSFLNKDITTVFGDKLRSLTVNLAHKMAGFSNKDTTKLFLENIGPSSTSSTLLIPEDNYQLLTHESPSVKEFVYSGVVIRILPNGGFSVHGYDLLSLEFKVLERSPSSRATEVSEGGTPSDFKVFTFGVTYAAGDIVKNNNDFFQAIVTHEAITFISSNWVKLQSLPTINGLNVTYYPERTNIFNRVQYGTVFDNVQDVFDMLIGYGEFLERSGWDFSTVNQYNQIENWLTYAKKFLFWASSEWEDNNVLFLSPNSEQITLNVDQGYAKNIERLSNGVYSILNKFGVSIDPASTVINRNGTEIQVIPLNIEDAVYYLRVETAETEHVLLVDNTTEFGDVVYDPLFRARQNRLKFVGTKTMDWFGKKEAGGYLIIRDKIVPNFENQASSILDFYNTETFHDNVAAEEAARHLIGHETRDYLDALEIADDVQFNFYQGFIRQKGTPNSITKLLRSNNITSKDNISLEEEWAIKQNEFGGLVDNVTVEMVIDATQLKIDPQLVRLTHIPSEELVLKELKLSNQEERYAFPPEIIIASPNSSLPNSQTATAEAIIESGRIVKIEITNSGRGYLSQPRVSLSKTTKSGVRVFFTPARNNQTIPNRDRMYPVMRAFVPEDSPRDKIIEINIADTDKWILKPKDQDLAFSVPLHDGIDFQLPSGGYANLNDVFCTAFSPAAIFNTWATTPMETREVKGTVADTCWIAKNVLETWNVYKIYQHSTNVKLVDDGDGFANLQFLADPGPVTPLPNEPRHNLLTAHSLDERGNLILEIGIINLRSTDINDLYQYVRVLPPIAADEEFDPSADAIYALYDTSNIRINFEAVSDISFTVNVFKGLRFGRIIDIETWVDNKDTYWIDRISENWAVFKKGTNEPFRQQEPLINTDFYDNLFIRDSITNETRALLGVIDPFKGILPGVAEQNIDFKTLTDPARYNVSNDEVLFDPSSVFNEKHIGKTWWDLSVIRTLYYEQPAVKTPGMSPSAVVREEEVALNYAQVNWGKFFPGSVMDVYEWVVSLRPPNLYTGGGTPKSTTDYVQLRRFNPAKNQLQFHYYFWVKGISEVPSLKNRTISTIETERLLANPRGFSFRWFAPVRTIKGQATLLIANSSNILANGTSVIQLNYKTRKNVHPEHVQWKLIRENDRFTTITDEMWNKLVDSLIGFSIPLPPEQYPEGVPLEIDLDGNILSVELPIPNPKLSQEESLGIKIRPQQSMFKNKFEARRSIISAINQLMSEIKIWSIAPNWSAPITTSVYWEEIDWFAEEFNEVSTNPSRRVDFTNELNSPSLKATLVNKEMIKVSLAAPSATDRFEIYQFNKNTDVFTLVRREKGTARLKDTLFDGNVLISLRKEFREILGALKNNLFVGQLAPNINKTYIAAVIYAFSEQRELDWAFKTSYVTLIQEGRQLGQTSASTAEIQREFIDYINEAKPYHTKLRKIITTINTEVDTAVGIVMDESPPDNIGIIFDITVDFSRITTDSDPAIISTDVIDALTFKFDWDSGAYGVGGGTLMGRNEDTGDQIEIDEKFSLGWDSLNLKTAIGADKPNLPTLALNDLGNRLAIAEAVVDNGIITAVIIVNPGESYVNGQAVPVTHSVGVGAALSITSVGGLGEILAITVISGGSGYITTPFGATSTVHIDGKSYIYPHNTPQELVQTQSIDNLVIVVDTEVVDSSNIQRDPSNVLITTPISYRINVRGTGENKISRNADSASTTLASVIESMSTIVHVSSGAAFPTPVDLIPHAFWIGAERIEYFGKIGSILIGIHRGTQDTMEIDHAIGDKVFVESNNVPPGDMTGTIWFKDTPVVVDTDLPPTGANLVDFQDTDGELGRFFQDQPGTANT